MLGKVLKGSGWEWVMTKANVFSSGRVSSSLTDEYSSWGWVWDGTKWVPLWTTKKVASAACEALVRCGCRLPVGVIVNVVERGNFAQHCAPAEVHVPIMEKTHRYQSHCICSCNSC